MKVIIDKKYWATNLNRSNILSDRRDLSNFVFYDLCEWNSQKECLWLDQRIYNILGDTEKKFCIVGDTLNSKQLEFYIGDKEIVFKLNLYS